MVQVYVSNIAWKSSEDDIRNLFEDSGQQVENVRIIKGEDGRSRGFGFVSFTNDRTDISMVIEKLNGQELGGRVLLVQRANGVGSRAKQ